MLIVKGDRRVKVGSATESKQFNRELTLPEFVDISALQSYLSDNGSLTMEAPVLLDRVYNDPALTSSHTYRQASPNRLIDTSFNTARQPNLNYDYGNNQGNTYSSTSSTSSYRQEGPAFRDTEYRRRSPLRDPYSSTTSSTSTLIGGTGINNSSQAPVTFSTLTSRPDYGTTDRNDGAKDVTYKFNLSEFAPEDIAIQVNDTMLKVTALKQQRDGRGSAHREFRREIGKLNFSVSFCR